MTTAQYSPANFNHKVLTTKQYRTLARMFDATTSDDAFVDTFQSRSRKQHPEHYSLFSLLKAVDNTAALFQQYPIDDKSVKSLALDVFWNSRWLQKDPSIAYLDGVLYVIGGRHRISAIASVFAGLTIDKTNDLEERAELFELYLAQYIRCDVSHLSSQEDLLALVISDNESRTMRKSEHQHLKAQTLGSDGVTPESVADVLFSCDLTPAEARDISGQLFALKHSDEKALKPDTKQIIGEKVGNYVIFNVEPGQRLKANTESVVTSKTELLDKMDAAWDIMLGLVKENSVVARNANKLAERIISAMKGELNPAVADAIKHSSPVPTKAPKVEASVVLDDIRTPEQPDEPIPYVRPVVATPAVEPETPSSSSEEVAALHAEPITKQFVPLYEDNEVVPFVRPHYVVEPPTERILPVVEAPVAQPQPIKTPVPVGVKSDDWLDEFMGSAPAVKPEAKKVLDEVFNSSRVTLDDVAAWKKSKADAVLNEVVAVPTPAPKPPVSVKPAPAKKGKLAVPTNAPSYMLDASGEWEF